MTIEKASVGGVCLWLEGYTQEEIGQRMGISRQNAQLLLKRAVLRLKTIAFSRDFEL